MDCQHTAKCQDKLKCVQNELWSKSKGQHLGLGQCRSKTDSVSGKVSCALSFCVAVVQDHSYWVALQWPYSCQIPS